MEKEIKVKNKLLSTNLIEQDEGSVIVKVFFVGDDFEHYKCTIKIPKDRIKQI